MITENGWPSCGPDMLERNPVPGTGIVIPLQRGIPNRILKAFAADFHAFVESLDNARGGTDEGGWTPTNSVATSNHLGGSAMDLNWSEHTFLVSYSGFDQREIAAMRELLAFYNFEGVQMVFWAQDWDSPKDPMHVQMGYGTYEDRPKCERFIAAKIRADGFSTYRRGGGNSPAAPTIPRRLVIPDAGGTWWADVSQYQGTPVNDSYPHPVFCFRTNTGDVEDALVDENARAARAMLDSGKLTIVIPYYFFRPGQANCDLHKETLERTGLFNHPRTVTMVDVEGDKGSVQGDNSFEINDEVSRIAGWYANANRVIGYLNSNADASLWPTRMGINLVVPQYNPPGGQPRTPGDISTIRDAQVRHDAIAHQYTSTATDVVPWTGRNVDMNWSPYNTTELLQLFGMVPMPPQPVQPPEKPSPAPGMIATPEGEWITQAQAIEQIFAKERGWYSLSHRPRHPDETDDQLGQVLNARAEGLFSQACIVALAEKAGVDVAKLYAQVQESLQ